MMKPSPNSASDKTLVELQHVVSRKLGGCLIRLQQYELLMKAMLAARTVEGSFEQIEKIRVQNSVNVQSKTLGALVKEFCEEFVASEGPAKSLKAEENKSSNRGAEEPWFSYKYTMEMPPEDHERTTAALRELKELRNQLVHHFLERFPLVNESSCQAAEVYLDASYATINNRCLQLKDWATNMDSARAMSSSFVQTQLYEDLVCNGINPDGTVDWPASGVVQALREAEIAGAKEGWTLLDSAIAWLRADYADQTPTKYQCKTWKQVLKRSKQFEIRVAVDPASKRGQTWFRSKVAA